MIARPKIMRGFTLLEVLVSLIILMIGLLGIAGLLIKGQRASYEAYQRQQALSLAQEMAEKIRSNQGGAPFYNIGVTESGTMPGRGNLYAAITPANDCLGEDCTSQQLAQNHLATWDGVLTGASETLVAGGTRIGGIINARGCIEWQPNNDTVQPIFWVSVAWQGEGDTVAPAATASACGQGLYGTEERRRLVTLRVSTCRLNAAAPWGCAP
jgi:type IV pilus assembly protein PilV